MPIGALIGGIGSLIAGNQAADAEKHAADLQYQMYQQTVQREQPFVDAGGGAINALQAGLGIGPGGTGQGYLNTPFNPSMLENTPGYKFELAQGEQAINDTATARGGVGGGNTLKALMGYGQGLASTTYQQQLQDYMAQQQQAFGQLYNVANLGETAGSNSTTGGSAYGANIGSAIAGAGAYGAAGLQGLFGGIGGALGGGLSKGLNYLLGSGGGGGGAGGGVPYFDGGFGG